MLPADWFAVVVIIMLTPCVICLDVRNTYVPLLQARLINRMNEQRTNYAAENKH